MLWQLFIEFSQTINLRTAGGMRISLGDLLQRTAEQLEGRERVEKKVAHDPQPASQVLAEVDDVPPGRVTSDAARHDLDRKSTRLNSSHSLTSRMPSSA